MQDIKVEINDRQAVSIVGKFLVAPDAKITGGWEVCCGAITVVSVPLVLIFPSVFADDLVVWSVAMAGMVAVSLEKVLVFVLGTPVRPVEGSNVGVVDVCLSVETVVINSSDLFSKNRF